MTNKPIIILGGGGHAAVLVDLLKYFDRSIIGFVAPSEGSLKGYPDLPYLGEESVIYSKYSPDDIELVNGVGSVSVEKNAIRQNLFMKFKDLHYQFETFIHPSAIVAKTATLGEGTQVMARVVIQANTRIGMNTIINTAASIDHDCQIGDHVHVAPGVTLSGNVFVGNNSHIGVGATIIQQRTLAERSMVRAGRTLIKDLKD